ncbi:maleylpyruvate isomerase N-terminal domain-containing protein, partial [Saccharomonospora halophila]|uniref:maleylpyruvate isomerase N-terminal domain-containing protein n=1 Tax=Saccharomonospora halophila TaxID=129922 RepID=UPI00035D5804
MTDEGSPGRVPDDVAYRHILLSITGLLQNRPGVASVRVPSCPDWTVRDLVAHLVGICDSVVRGGDGGPPGGRERSGTDVAAPDLSVLLTRWSELSGLAGRYLAEADPRHSGLAVLDALSHELDLRYALDAPIPADHPALPGAFAVAAAGFSAEVADRGLPAIEL